VEDVRDRGDVSGGYCSSGRLQFQPRPFPWQQFMQSALWHIGDAGEHIGEPGVRIDIVELCRLYRPANYAEYLF
jgi:hypothetical protein